MRLSAMHLTITVPEEVFARVDVEKLTADGIDGSFCLLPNHIDYVAALPVGILSYVEAGSGREVFVAVDRGVLVKRGADVRVSVRRAASHSELERLEETVRQTYGEQTDEERAARRASANLEASFVRRFLDLKE
jgi:F-type H+-transporting ATPase subunit epsilon